MRLHTGRILTETELSDALAKVADGIRKNAHSMRKGGDYASHITEADKDELLASNLAYADEVEQGLHNRNFTIWQKVDYICTGISVPLLP